MSDGHNSTGSSRQMMKSLVEDDDIANSSNRVVVDDEGKKNHSHNTNAKSDSQLQLQLQRQEHDRRLIQLLQYIATMNTGSTSSTCGDSSTVTSNSATSSTISSSATSTATGVRSNNNPTKTTRSNNNSIFVRQFVISSSTTTIAEIPQPPPFFYSAVQQQLMQENQRSIILQQKQLVDKTIGSNSSIVTTCATTIPTTGSSSGDDNKHRDHDPIIFTTDTFRYCWQSSSSTTTATSSSSSSLSNLPFTFYGSPPTATKSTSSNCWLRLTRLSIPTASTTFTNDTTGGGGSISGSKSSNNSSSRQTSRMKQILEPIYNRLFDYIQQQENEKYELVWGFGHAYYCIASPSSSSTATKSSSSSSSSSMTIINGPLLEVPIEIELGKNDGAIYFRPKQSQQQSSSSSSSSSGVGCGGIRINREVLTAILRNNHNSSNNNDSSTSKQSGTADTLLQTWYRKIQNGDVDVAQLSPAQPESYRPILQQMAVELISNGIFIDSTTLTNNSSSSNNHIHYNNMDVMKSCIITDTWCLYKANKPTSILSRDALAFADRISNTMAIRDNGQSANTTSVQQLSPATWAITHGPGSYERYMKKIQEMERKHTRGIDWVQWIRFNIFQNAGTSDIEQPHQWAQSIPMNIPTKISLPLPSTDAQHRIVDMLLYQNYPCVVVEGPPGTGKSQTICNMICAYLRVGKRVLVTSKHSSSLSVIRQRLPKTIQELCIDVSNSEYNGVRQLQQTVERLSNRLANSTYQKQMSTIRSGGGGGQSSSTASSTVSNMDIDQEKLLNVQKLIDSHEEELKTIDETITVHYKKKYKLLQSTDGKQFTNIAIELLIKTPWLMSLISKWTPYEVMKLRDRVEVFVLHQRNDPIERVCNYPNLPSNALISLAASYANMKLHVASNAAKKAVASMPLLGSWIGMDIHTINVEKELSLVRIGDYIPATPDDWLVVAHALRRARAIYLFGQGEWKTYEHQNSWPCASSFFSKHDNVRDLHTNLCKAVEMKNLCWKLNICEMSDALMHCQLLDAKRCMLSKQIHVLSEELVNLTVVAELCRSLSEEALSALIRFSQIAGKAKFQRPSIPVAKMTQRQRRHRDDYLDAFDRCCRYIPCWILTTSQISDFLPPEPLFDLVIIDETSQSDITVLPTMLRGKQWLIVGDGKQVSPTETFVSEEHMDDLRAIIPQCFFESALLPGQSFFDLCAQAFPTSRVVLIEHFRCASEIIAFSNEHFYDNQLIPLRLPTQSERITPSIIDVRMSKGIKVGKTNEQEVDEIVRQVATIVELHGFCSQQPQQRRSIGIISLMGDEQSRLIRGRLLDTIGPLRMTQHSILVGDPPSFQGTERDIIFLSMVCSPGRSPTQSQLVHFQRANVALSRARDQCILIRSIDITDIPSSEDVKIPIIEYFQNDVASRNSKTTGIIETSDIVSAEAWMMGDKNVLRGLLVSRLNEKGYKLCNMGVVWKDGICVEHPECDMRMALIIDDVSETYQDWWTSYQQQQKIEGVGWKCLRVDVLSFLSDCEGTMQSIFEFLKQIGIHNSDIRKIEGKDNIAFHASDNIVSETVPSSSTIDHVERNVRINKRGALTSDTGDSKVKTKRSRINRKKRHTVLQGGVEAEIESLVTQDSQSNCTDDEVVVDLTFLRGGC